jgi:F-type H+-transporting ATPase subunit epsilon
MKEFKIVISTPDGNLYEGNIVKISLRASEGDLAIMANHTPLVTSVKPCECRMELDDGSRKALKVERGLLSVSADVVTLMSGSAKWI